MRGSGRFRSRVPVKVPAGVPGGFVAGSGAGGLRRVPEHSGKGFGRVPEGSGKGSGRGSLKVPVKVSGGFRKVLVVAPLQVPGRAGLGRFWWVRVSGSFWWTFRRRFRKVRRVPGGFQKVPVKVSGGFRKILVDAPSQDGSGWVRVPGGFP